MRRRCFLIRSGGGWAGPAASPSLVPPPEPLGEGELYCGSQGARPRLQGGWAPFLSLSGAFSETRLQVATRGACALHVMRQSHCRWPARAPGCAPSPCWPGCTHSRAAEGVSAPQSPVAGSGSSRGRCPGHWDQWSSGTGALFWSSLCCREGGTFGIPCRHRAHPPPCPVTHSPGDFRRPMAPDWGFHTCFLVRALLSSPSTLPWLWIQPHHMDVEAGVGEVKNMLGHTAVSRAELSQFPRLRGLGWAVCEGPQVPYLLRGVRVCPAGVGWVESTAPRWTQAADRGCGSLFPSGGGEGRG